MKKLLAAIAAASVSLSASAFAATEIFDIEDTPQSGKHGLWLPKFINGQGGNAQFWSIQDGSTFTTNMDGTAQLKASVVNEVYSPFGFEVEINLVDEEVGGTRFCSGGTCSSTNDPSMSFWTWGASTLTGTGDIAGMIVDISDQSQGKHPFQFGQGGDAFTQLALGGSGWLSWDIRDDTLPALTGFVFKDMTTGSQHGDFNFVAPNPPSIVDPVPVPAGIVLFGTAAAGWMASRRRKA